MVASAKALVPRGPEDPLRAVAALVPARDDQLVEVDQMVGMEVGQQQRIERRAGGAGADQALGHARAAVDQEAPVAVADQARRAVAPGMDLRAAGAEQRDLHQAIRPPMGCGARSAAMIRMWWSGGETPDVRIAARARPVPVPGNADGVALDRSSAAAGQRLTCETPSRRRVAAAITLAALTRSSITTYSSGWWARLEDAGPVGDAVLELADALHVLLVVGAGRRHQDRHARQHLLDPRGHRAHRRGIARR